MITKRIQGMFHLFQSESDNESEEEKEPMYVIHPGKETPIFYSDKVFLSKFSVFWGCCYICHSTGHSQRYCSLKYCSRCGANNKSNPYGHSVVVCSEINCWKIKRREEEKQEFMKQILDSILAAIE